jgi:hypothetical protein
MMPFFFVVTGICLTLALICFMRGLMHQQQARIGYLILCGAYMLAAITNALMVFRLWPS